MSSFDTWRTEDAAWIVQHKFLIQRVYRWFLETGDWPDIEVFQRVLDQEGHDADAREFATSQRQLPFMAGGYPSNIPLRTRHLLDIPEFNSMLVILTIATGLAVDAYMNLPADQSQIFVTRADLEPRLAPEQRLTLDRLPKYLITDWPNPLSGTHADAGSWQLSVVPTLARQFRTIGRDASYVDIQASIIKKYCDEHDERIGSIPKPGPYTAFVIMPIGGEWSALVHKFIKGAIELFDGTTISSIRADEITENGRIDDQVIQRLRDSDFVIADVTHDNLNVFWELGFAYAHDKPCVLLRQTDSTLAPPFDIYVQRRVEYSPNPTKEDAKSLVALIEDAIDKVRAREASNQPNLADLYRMG